MVSKIDRLQCDEVFLLRSVDYGEDHRILSCLTSKQGRVDLMVHGAKKSQKRALGSLDFLNHLQIEYETHPRGGLHRLVRVDLVEGFLKIRSDYERLILALEWFRLLSGALPKESVVPSLFEILRDHLRAMQHQDAAWVDLAFRYRALAALGYHMELDACLECGDSENVVAFFSPTQGGLLCGPCAPNLAVEQAVSFFPKQWWQVGENLSPWSKGKILAARKVLGMAFEEYLGIGG